MSGGEATYSLPPGLRNAQVNGMKKVISHECSMVSCSGDGGDDAGGGATVLHTRASAKHGLVVRLSVGRLVRPLCRGESL